MEKKELSEVVHLAKANNEEAITELLKRFEPLIASMNHHYFFHEMDQEDFPTLIFPVFAIVET